MESIRVAFLCLMVPTLLIVHGAYDFSAFENAIKQTKYEPINEIDTTEYTNEGIIENGDEKNEASNQCELVLNKTVPYFLALNESITKLASQNNLQDEFVVDKIDGFRKTADRKNDLISASISALTKLVDEKTDYLVDDVEGLKKMIEVLKMAVEKITHICNCNCEVPEPKNLENGLDSKKDKMIISLLAEGINVISNNGTNIYGLVKGLDKKFNIFLNETLSPHCVLTNDDKMKQKKEFETWQRSEFSKALTEYFDYVKSYTINYGSDFEIWLRRSPLSAFLISSLISFVFGLLVGTCICLLYSYCQNCRPMGRIREEIETDL